MLRSVGIDTHQDQHVAVAVDQLGIRLNEYSTDNHLGIWRTERWARDLGQVWRIRYRRDRFLRRRSRLLDQRGYAVFEPLIDRFAIAGKTAPPMQRWQRGQFLLE